MSNNSDNERLVFLYLIDGKELSSNELSIKNTK